MSLKSPWHSINLAPILWNLEPGSQLVQVLQPGQRCLALGTAL